MRIRSSGGTIFRIQSAQEIENKGILFAFKVERYAPFLSNLTTLLFIFCSNAWRDFQHNAQRMAA